LTYVLLTGYPPFDSEDDENHDKEILDAVLKGEYDLEDEELFENVSKEAKDFI